MRTVRVFVSSPGDAVHERRRVERVVERLSGAFASSVRLVTVRWEVSFYAAHATFQTQIPEATACDVVIAIFRNRLGTALPPDFPRMPDGEPYPSGSAYEVLTAIEARKTGELPDVFVFRNPSPPSVTLDDPAGEAQVRDQWERLKQFFERWFVTADGQFKAAFQSYDDVDRFERQVERLLRQWLEEHVLGAKTLAWPIAAKGSPFRGLEAFGAKHAEVFFGRDRDIERAADTLKDAASAGERLAFLLLIGPSGSGKSSLARAGLLPGLTAAGVVPEVDLWRTAVMRPAEVAGDPFLSLATRLFDAAADLTDGEAGRPPALPELRDGD
ncbi:MAG: hypothetical protein FJX11_20315, partial [Alphaproteobacteria bacterium]|nr:hypothetical protein [Alphaproteobacteria bacterium]